MANTNIANTIISAAESLLGISNSTITTAVNDFTSIFGANISANSILSYVQSYVSTVALPTIESIPALSSTSSDNTISSLAYTPNNVTRVSPANSQVTGSASPNVRHVSPIGNEPPAAASESIYPYNKAYLSESGHLKEVDDTPGNERLLDQHVSGTYQEMKASGDHVIKVVGDGYTIVAGSDHITVQGNILIHGEKECNIRIGGAINIIADHGINIVSKGALRVRSDSLNFESTSGDISFKSAKNVLFSAADSFSVNSAQVVTKTTGVTSIASTGSVIVDSAEIFQHTTGDIIMSSGGAIDMKAGSSIVQSSTSTEIDGTLNVKSTTNMKASGSPVLGQGAQSVSSTPPTPLVPTASNGSGITAANNPSDIYMLNDDDDDASMTAIQQGIANGTINPADLVPPASSQTDTSAGGGVSPTTTTSTVTDVGSAPIDNLQLSPHFTVGSLSKHAIASPCVVTAQHGLTATQITRNLQLLAINCLEPIKKQYPDMQVTSAFRIGSSKSQHELGMAADMQFASANSDKSLYFAYAQWVKNNVPFDQIILEYKNDGTKLPWLHVSFNSKGNRGMILTKFAGGGYGQGLHDLSGP